MTPMAGTTGKRKLFERISIDPGVMVGKPVVRGTRIPVQLVIRLLGLGASVEEVLTDYPSLTVDDVRTCLLYAAEAVEASTVRPGDAAGR